MFLEKVELQGFKSFARRTTLQFVASSHAGATATGLTVIVGPNGSGKSNIADAVRWVLGEQSIKLLRGKKTEDVIFSGSASKGRLGMAEVSLYINNEDKKVAVDYTELVITRRLYRDGESEYLLNGTKVRLLDIVMLLARANIGQRSYSVVGQGMVDAFLNTTPAERKDFFDEATGVKVYQIKRHEAHLKLKGAEQNLEQAETLLAEIEPRLKSLTRQVKKLEQRAELEEELRGLQLDYYANEWHGLSARLEATNRQVLEQEQEQRACAHELEKIQQELQEREQSQYQAQEREEIERRQRAATHDRSRAMQKLAEVRAQKQVSLEVAGKTDVAWLYKKSAELETAIARFDEEVRRARQTEAEAQRQLEAVQQTHQAIDRRIAGLRADVLGSRRTEAGDEAKTLQRVQAAVEELAALYEAVNALLEAHKDIRDTWNDLRHKVQELRTLTQRTDAAAAQKFEELNQALLALESEKDTASKAYIEAQAGYTNAQHAVRRFEEQASGCRGELEAVSRQIKQAAGSSKDLDKDWSTQEKTLTTEVAELDQRLEVIEQELLAVRATEAAARERIMALQRKSHEAQGRYNAIGTQLNEARVEKARFETRLEDAEAEIRRETENLRAVIDHTAFDSTLDKDVTRERIQKIKRQLELIGGIDPEVQKEYEETKERYEFLHAQSTDLRSAISSLKKVIEELDKTIAGKFDTAFAQIGKKFEEYFAILFNGGTVKLEKIMEDAAKVERAAEAEAESESLGEAETLEEIKEEELEKKGIELRKVKKVLTGIDITACPPHKKVKHISMLSGGERALTSIALIAAIIAVNPAPFVILDEVDAALDEANSLRLAKILEDLSKKTQFIAITHNRTIMYKADIIYGVTMGEDGISKLLSVKVEDVKAARQ